MKGYCGPQDVRWALAPLDQQEDNATAARLTDPQIIDAITEAEGIVDSYVARRYVLTPADFEYIGPGDPPPAPVTWQRLPAPLWAATRDVAAYLAALTNNKGRNMTEDDPVRLRYGVALSLLTNIRDGKADLDEEDFPPVATSGDIVVINTYEPAMFGKSDVGLPPYPGYNPQINVPYRGW